MGGIAVMITTVGTALAPLNEAGLGATEMNATGIHPPGLIAIVGIATVGTAAGAAMKEGLGQVEAMASGQARRPLVARPTSLRPARHLSRARRQG